jgi:hypothetical protein
VLVAGLLGLTACGGDDAPAPTPTTLSASSSSVAPPTSEPPACADLAEDYLDTFFALGAGTPEDPDATTVRLPVAELLAIDEQARDAGCRDFTDVACSAYAELEAQGLEATNSDPPRTC